MENSNLTSKIKFSNFIFLLIAGIINSIGVTLFLYPVQLFDSGVSGLSMLLDQVTPYYLTLSIFLIVINLPIFIFGLKRQGVAFTVYSIFAIAIYSLSSFIIMNVLPIDISDSSPLAKSDLFLCAVFGGLISGVGSGLTIRFGGAIDGIDVLSVTFAKKLNISIGTFVLIFNIILYIICGIILNSWVLPLYSIVTYFVGSKTIDFIVDGFNRSKCAMIITDKAEEVTNALSLNFANSGTIVKAHGGYSKKEKNIIFFVLNQFQINKMKTLVRSIDKDAYISLQEVSDVVKTVQNKKN